MITTASMYKSLGEALAMESSNPPKIREAYTQYLCCIELLVSNMKTLVTSDPTNFTLPIDKVFYFIRESIDRSEQLLLMYPHLFKTNSYHNNNNNNNHPATSQQQSSNNRMSLNFMSTPSLSSNSNHMYNSILPDETTTIRKLPPLPYSQHSPNSPSLGTFSIHSSIVDEITPQAPPLLLTQTGHDGGSDLHYANINSSYHYQPAHPHRSPNSPEISIYPSARSAYIESYVDDNLYGEEMKQSLHRSNSLPSAQHFQHHHHQQPSPEKSRDHYSYSNNREQQKTQHQQQEQSQKPNQQQNSYLYQDYLPWSYTPGSNVTNNNNNNKPLLQQQHQQSQHFQRGAPIPSTQQSPAYSDPSVHNTVASTTVSNSATERLTTSFVTELLLGSKKNSTPDYYSARRQFNTRVNEKEVQMWGSVFNACVKKHNSKFLSLDHFYHHISLLALSANDNSVSLADGGTSSPNSDFVILNNPRTVNHSDCFAGHLFHAFDINRSNSLDISDWQYSIGTLLYGTEKERAEFSYCLFDPDASGQLTRQMFTTAMSRVYKLLYHMGLDIFNITSHDNLSTADLTSVTPSNNMSSVQRCNSLFDDLFGVNKNKVTRDEFIQSLMDPSKCTRLSTLGLLNPPVGHDKIHFQKSGAPVIPGSRSFGKVLNMMLGIRMAQQQISQMWNMRLYGMGSGNGACVKTMKLYSRDCAYVMSFELPRVVLEHPNSRESSNDAGPLFMYESVPSGISSSAYRFKDYAPLVFRNIRSRFGISEDEYAMALSPEQLLGNLLCGKLTTLSEKLTDGKSGNFFFYSDNGQFLCKTISTGELETFLRILPGYYNHICKYSDTLITRYYGLHCINDTVFVVMGNVFQTSYKMDYVYDLKGSTIGRTAFNSQEEAKDASDEQMRSKIMKDLDWIAQQRQLNLTSWSSKFLEQLTIDSKFLEKCDIIDYSLLVGIRKLPRVLPPQNTSNSRNGSPTVPFHQQFEGGILYGDTVFYLGIIDTLIEYGVRKKVEHHLKSFRYGDGTGISVTDPRNYSTRFLAFIHNQVPGDHTTF